MTINGSNAMKDHDIDVSLCLGDRYQFTVDFGREGVSDLVVDEPPPLGDGIGPNASRMLAAAVGNCLGASLLFCLRKAHLDPQHLQVHVTGSVVRNDQGRFRIPDLGVRLDLELPPDQRQRAKRCLEIFEDFCLVTQSVRAGIDVSVNVEIGEPVASGNPT